MKKLLLIACTVLGTYSVQAVTTSLTWYRDADGDGWGNPSITITSSSKPSGYVLNNLDCNDNSANTSVWRNLGAAGFTTYGVSSTSIAVDNSSVPYIAFVNNNSSISVSKYVSGSWTSLPDASNSNGSYVSMALNSSGNPVVLYKAGYAATCKRYNGSSWDVLGSSTFTPSGADYTSLAIAPSGDIYAAFKDLYYAVNGKVTVMKYSGSSWSTVGTQGFSAGDANYVSIAVTASGIPYVVYQDGANSNKATVRRYNGSTWETVGGAGFSAGTATYTTIAIDDAGTPYVSYCDGNSSSKATVMKYNGSSWVVVGSVGFSAGATSYNTLTLDAYGTPYVTYKDASNSNKATVMYFNGTSWTTAVSAGITAGTANETVIGMSPKGIPFIFYSDAANSNKASVMSLDFNTNTPTSPVLSSSVSSSCSSGPVTLSVTGGSLNDATQWVWYSGSCGGTYLGTGTSITTTLTATSYYYCRAEGTCATATGSCSYIKVTLATPTTWYLDADGDGWGSSSTTSSCTAPSGYVANNQDCNDASVNTSGFRNVGAAGASPNSATHVSLAFNSSNVPYVAYLENTTKGSVISYNSSANTWPYVGSGQFTSGQNLYTSLKITSSGMPIMAYQDGYKASCMKYSSGSWSMMGATGFTPGGAPLLSMALGKNDTPFVAYYDDYYTVTGKISVMKFNGTSWVQVGTQGFSSVAYNDASGRTSIAVDTGSNTIYVAYIDNSTRKCNVMTFNGATWSLLGSAGISAGNATYPNLTLDNTGTPYLVYSDAANSNKATVKRYNGSSWVTVGSVGFTSGTATYTTILVDKAGAVLVAYNDASNSNKATVMKYNGTSWSVFGSAGFSAGTATYFSFALDNQDIPYLAVADAGSSNKASIFKLAPRGTSPTTPTISASATSITCGSSTTLTISGGSLNDATNWYWYTGSCGGTLIGSGTSIVVYPTTNTTYYARAEGGVCLWAAGACGSININVSSGAPVIPAFTSSGQACVGSTITMANALPSGTWSSSNTGVATINSTTGILGGVAAGTTTISYVVNYSCGYAVRTQTVTVNPQPTSYTVSGGGSICGSGSLAINLSGSQSTASYQLFRGATSVGSPLSGTGSALGMGSYGVAGVYTVAATLNGCVRAMSGSATITNNAPSITLGAMPTVCQGTHTANISYTGAVNAPTTYSIVWSAGALSAGFTNVTNATLPTSAITVVNPNVAGVFTGSLTVANSSCSSTSYPLTITIQSAPTASITSAATPCDGRPINLRFAGTSGAVVTYKINGGSATTATLTGGVFNLTTALTTGTHTFNLVSVDNSGCTRTVDTTTIVGHANVISWVGGTADSTTAWNVTKNWSCGSVPLATDSVVISGGVTFSPVVSGSMFTKQLVLNANAQITINSGATLSVQGSLYNNGSISGNGTTILNGATAQYIYGRGTVSNLTVNNTSGAAVIAGNSLSIQKVLTVSNGTLTTADSLVLLASETGTARVAPMSNGSISGNALVQQYIQGGRRAYRFVSHPFNAAIALEQLTPFIDITGTGGATNGFTTTGSNASSAFRYDPTTGNSSLSYDPGWKAFTSTSAAVDSNNFKRYMGIRLFVRGAKGEGMGYDSYIPSAVVYTLKGVLNQGAQNIVLAKGAGANQDYNLIGNPYASPIDIGTIAYNAKASGKIVGAAFYVWNPYLATNGMFQAVPIGTSAPMPYYIQGGAAFEVRAANNGELFTINETDKAANATTALLKQANQDVQLSVYDSKGNLWDMTTVRFDEAATADEDNNWDARKLMSGDFGFYTVAKDGTKLSIDTRPYTDDVQIPLGIQSTATGNYSIVANNYTGYDDLYLLDNYTNTYTLLQTGTTYNFAINSEATAKGNNRFAIVARKANVVNATVQVYPNPATDNITVVLPSSATAATIVVTDVLGKKVLETKATQGSTQLAVGSLVKGIYVVDVQGEGVNYTTKIVLE